MNAIDWLNELEKKANMATSGEWECPGGCHIWREQNGKVYIIARCAPYNCLNNGWFISAANPDTVKRLIDMLRVSASIIKAQATIHNDGYTASTDDAIQNIYDMTEPKQ